MINVKITSRIKVRFYLFLIVISIILLFPANTILWKGYGSFNILIMFSLLIIAFNVIIPLFVIKGIIINVYPQNRVDK